MNFRTVHILCDTFWLPVYVSASGYEGASSGGDTSFGADLSRTGRMTFDLFVIDESLPYWLQDIGYHGG
jgi:hypothetical protein